MPKNTFFFFFCILPQRRTTFAINNLLEKIPPSIMAISIDWFFFPHIFSQQTASPTNERSFINTTSLTSDDEMIDITPNNVSNPNYQYHSSSNGSGGREDGVGGESLGATGSGLGGSLHAGSDNSVRTSPTHSRFGRDFHSDHEGKLPSLN